MTTVLTAEAVRERLRAVMDPEIPVCSIVDLGIVEQIYVRPRSIEVDLLPTFAGCPALDVIREDVQRAVSELAPEREITVRMILSPPWTSDRMTESAREAMKTYGIAPPGAGPVVLQIGAPPARVACPYCGADATEESSAFGPTPCRAIRYCPACRNPFESFKPKRAR